MTAPNGDLPGEGGYYAEGSGTSSLTDYNTLDEDGAKARMKDSVALPFDRLKGSFWGTIITGLDAVADAVGSVVETVVGVVVSGVNAIAENLEELLKGVHDHEASEQARIEGEQAVVDNWGSAMDKIDESVRTGGALSSWGTWRVEEGDNNWHAVPMTRPMWPAPTEMDFDPVTGYRLMEGTSYRPADVWDQAILNKLNAETTTTLTLTESRSLAAVSDYLVLDEGGLWLIFYQLGSRPYNSSWVGTTRPALEVCCFVTPDEVDKVPIGPPDGTTYPAHWTNQATPAAGTTMPASQVQGYGRGTGYATGSVPGGYTVSGMLPTIIPSGGYRVSMACQQDWHFGGAATTFLWAFKVNTETLRADLDAITTQLSGILPVPEVLSEVDYAQVASSAASLKGDPDDTGFEGIPDWRQEAPWPTEP